jgi:hypothetical protein
MASFAALPDEQRWEVAFYVSALRFSAEAARAGEAWLKGRTPPGDLTTMSTLATSSDDELSGKIEQALPDAPREQVLAYLRRGLLEKRSTDPLLVARGFGAGIIALLIATLAIFKLGLRMPLKYFFGATGTLLYIMAFIFAGTGVNQLQAAGWISATPLNFPPAVPLLGIYPTMETLAAQGVLLCTFIATSLWMTLERKRVVA